ncbi:hypothetical protein DL770_001539 [Monosporascus sp. CRB-9-2]|nr:hypothetical protein DL770_001539 [Monosporascus sp. CRB-9-2]
MSGIGMIGNYYLALGLALTYFVVLAVNRLKIIRPPDIETPQGWATARVVESFQQSINTFLDASLVFPAAMLEAVLVRYAAVIRDPKEKLSAYGMIGSVFTSAFSIFPVLMLQTVVDVGHLILALNLVWWLYDLLWAIIPSRWKEAWNSRPRRFKLRWDWRTSVRIANVIVCFVTACFLISLFHRYRHSLNELANESNKETD